MSDQLRAVGRSEYFCGSHWAAQAWARQCRNAAMSMAAKCESQSSCRGIPGSRPASLQLRPDPSTYSSWTHSKGWRLSSQGEEQGSTFAQPYSHPHLPSKLVLLLGKRLDNRLNLSSHSVQIWPSGNGWEEAKWRGAGWMMLFGSNAVFVFILNRLTFLVWWFLVWWYPQNVLNKFHCIANKWRNSLGNNMPEICLHIFCVLMLIGYQCCALVFSKRSAIRDCGFHLLFPCLVRFKKCSYVVITKALLTSLFFFYWW